MISIPEDQGTSADTGINCEGDHTIRLAYHNAMHCQAKVRGKPWRGDDSPGNNGQPSASISRNPKLPRVVDALASRIDAAWKASSGSSGQGRSGASCPGGIAVPAPAGDGLNSGKRRGCCSRSGGPSWPNSMTRRSSAGMHALLMGALSPPNKGGQGRQDETRQGYKVDGSGRWRGDLCWEHTWRRLPRRKSCSSKRPSTRSPSGAPANPAGPGSAPTA
jgi:hypothetical protein